jgi:hypothetical protein
MRGFTGARVAVVFFSSVVVPIFQRSEIVGFIVLGTTFAAAPDLLSMLRRRSSAGHESQDVGHIGVF